MKFLNTLTLINTIIERGGPSVALAIRALRELSENTGESVDDLLDRVQGKNDVAREKIKQLLEETKS